MNIQEILGGEPSAVFVTIGMFALLFTPPVAFFILRRYRISVLQYMRNDSGDFLRNSSGQFQTSVFLPKADLKIEFVTEDTKLKTSSPVQSLLKRISTSKWKISLIYLVAGLAHAAISTTLLLVIEKLDFTIRRFVLLLFVLSWPIVPTIVLVAVGNRRLKIWGPLAFLLLGCVLSWPDYLDDVLLLWMISMGIPTAILLVFSNRKLRTVGSLVLLSLFVFTGGIVASFLISYHTLTLLPFENSLQLAFVISFIMVITLGGFIVLGWRLLKWLAARHQNKKTSDQLILLDAWWLLFTITECIFLSVKGGFWGLSGLLAFTGFKSITAVGLRLISANRQEPTRLRLLLLRVFGFPKRSERFLDELALNWRYIGCVNLFISSDLAAATLEPNEFLDYVTRRLKHRFIKSETDLNEKIKRMDLFRDPDGRYRLNDFCCQENTWRTTLRELLRKNDVMLMDLRGFNQKNKGCIYELTQLFNMTPFERIVLTIDNSTDMKFLHETLQHLWQTIAPSSPSHRSSNAVIKLLRVEKQSYKEMQRLLELLLNSAKISEARMALENEPYECPLVT